MAQELKLRVTNYKTVESNIKQLGGTLQRTTTFEDIYFKQPEGFVYKLSGDKNEWEIIKLTAVDGKFRIITKEPVADKKKIFGKLEKKYGVENTLKGKRITYALKGTKLQFNLIDSVGNFLVITSEEPTLDFVLTSLKINNPEFITVPFNKLPTLA